MRRIRLTRNRRQELYSQSYTGHVKGYTTWGRECVHAEYSDEVPEFLQRGASPSEGDSLGVSPSSERIQTGLVARRSGNVPHVYESLSI